MGKQDTPDPPSDRKASTPPVAPSAPRPVDATPPQTLKDTRDAGAAAPAAAAAKKDLLSETTVGKKEQRKADWAIMKEMAKYLWPKVSVPAGVACANGLG